MQVPFIKVVQRDEVFFITQFRVADLLRHLNFHFRGPYGNYKSDQEVVEYRAYINNLTKMGLNIGSSDEGVQRRLQIDRIKSIKEFIENKENNFLPGAVILSANISDDNIFTSLIDNYEDINTNNTGNFDFPENFHFSLIDGQHRLAGLSQVKKEILEEFHIPAVILFNVSKPIAAKLFADINGKQKSVNKSLIYDLYAEHNESNYSEIKKYHEICEYFYVHSNSPLYRQIKMLGIGYGAISQAFFIDYVIEAINKTDLKYSRDQIIYDHLFLYFRAFQKCFPNEWPVPVKFSSPSEVMSHARIVIKERKSQLAKTNGFGAIVKVFPKVYSKCNGDKNKYHSIISGLTDKISWVSGETLGTGKAIQNRLVEEIEKILGL